MLKDKADVISLVIVTNKSPKPSSGTFLSRVERLRQHFSYSQILASSWGFADPKRNHLVGGACWWQIGIKHCPKGWIQGKKYQRLRDFVTVRWPWLLLDRLWAGHLQPYRNTLICSYTALIVYIVYFNAFPPFVYHVCEMYNQAYMHCHSSKVRAPYVVMGRVAGNRYLLGDLTLLCCWGSRPKHQEALPPWQNGKNIESWMRAWGLEREDEEVRGNGRIKRVGRGEG